MELGLSLRQLAERTGIDNSRLSRWELGRKIPNSPDRLPGLAAALEVPVSELYSRLGPALADALPHLRPYLHTKYGQEVPHDALHELASYCESILTSHGVTVADAATEPVPAD